MQNVAVLEERRPVEAEERRQKRGVLRAQCGEQLLPRPDVEGPFLAVGLGVDGAPELAVAGRSSPRRGTRPSRAPPAPTPRRRCARAGGRRAAEGARCRRASSRSAGPSTRDPSRSGGSRRRAGRRCRRAPSGRACRRACVGVGASAAKSSSSEEVGRGRELRRRAEAAPSRVEAARERFQRARVAASRDGSSPPGVRAAREVAADGRASSSACSSTSARRCRQASPSALSSEREAGPAPAILRREVGAGEERLQLGRQEHRVRPAALAGQDLGGGHVDLVEVGPLLAVHLDADELLVHQRRDLGIGERLALHDVAPVAGRVADREEDRLVLGARSGDRLLAPGVPVDRVVGVEQEVGAGLAGQAVGRRHPVIGASYCAGQAANLELRKTLGGASRSS